MKSTKKFLGRNGQGLLEFILALPLLLIFWMALIWALLDSFGVMLWNYKIEKYLVCRKDESQKSTCQKQLKDWRHKIIWMELLQFEEKRRGYNLTAKITLQGNFNQKYEIQKYLDQSLWRK